MMMTVMMRQGSPPLGTGHRLPGPWEVCLHRTHSPANGLPWAPPGAPCSRPLAADRSCTSRASLAWADSSTVRYTCMHHARAQLTVAA